MWDNTGSWTLSVVALLSALLPPVFSGDECLAKKFLIITDHTACLKTSNLGQPRGVSDADAKEILALHNKLRASEKNATDMQLMVWDTELAAIAQKWADNCDFNHDKSDRRSVPGRFSVGQNLAVRQVNWSSTIQAWYDERGVFTYGNQSKNNFAAVGHYTQVVWAKSSKLGCGYTYCKNPSNEKNYVCNYGPGGNFGDWSVPYNFVAYDQCSSCPGNCVTSGDNEGLCNCSGVTCYNGGTLNLTSCTCSSCTQPFHIKANYCTLNCTDTADHSVCGTQAAFMDCASSNTRAYCPHMCDVCPYAAYDYVKPIPTTGNKAADKKTGDAKANDSGAPGAHSGAPGAPYTLMSWLPVLVIVSVISG